MRALAIRPAAAFPFAALTCAALAASPALGAGFDGKTVAFQHIFHATPFFVQDITGGPGVEVAEYYSLDLDGVFFEVQLNPLNTFDPNQGFNGPVLTDAYNALPDILSVKLVWSTFQNTPLVTWTANQIEADLSQTGGISGAGARFVVTFGPEADVPLPAGGALALTGLAALAAAARRRRARPAQPSSA
ncbi:hypothetical protein ACQ5SO_04000 [Rhodovulum sp. DZ06]|uniref:hypothetical protein n=1 Tax=Rhodovulum sp. DZ06 TaxID=3425126 RepID=UPI003D34F4CE